MKQFDVIIVGGGFVGYTAALACAHLGLTVAILEAKKHPLSQLQNQDGRAIALAYTSCLLLKNLSVWEHIQATPIKQVHTSQQGAFGKLRMRAHDLELDYLGQVVPAPTLGLALAQAVQAENNITEISPAQVTEIDESGKITYQVEEQSHTLSGSLIFACDGANSGWREKFGLDTQVKDHHQHAIVANIDIEKQHENTAYERFTTLGTLALLPLQRNRMTSVLSLENAAALQKLDDADYLQQLHQLFGKKLGTFSNLGKRFSYPLQSLQCTDMQRGRFLVLGNAAHTVNPIAAQGLNLAMRDIAVLIDCIKALGLTETALQSYTEKVLPAHQSMHKFTERLVKLAQPNKFKHLRSLGLFALDNVAPMKNSLAYTLAGLSAHRGRTLQAVQDVI